MELRIERVGGKAELTVPLPGGGNAPIDHKPVEHAEKTLGAMNKINKLLNKLSQILLCTIWTDRVFLIAVC